MSAPLPASFAASLEATKVSYVPLGSSGLRVSVPILGGMSIGTKAWAPWVVEEEEALALLKAAYDRGVNTWDTANMYSCGVSEEIIGKAVKKFNIPRHKVVIMTKCHVVVGEEPDMHGERLGQWTNDSKDYVNQGGLSRQAIFNAFEASLKRLDLEYVDVFQIHRFDPLTPVEETMKALHDLVQSGKVRYIGASSMWATQFAMLQHAAERNGWTKFVSMQNFYNLCYREEEREMNRYCRATGVGLICWGPLFAGRLARPLGFDGSVRSKTPSPMGSGMAEADEEIVRRVEKMAGEKGWAMSVVALLWLRSKGAVPIVGFSSVERIDEACGIRRKSLTEEEIKFLEEPYVPKAVVGHF